MGEVLTFHNVIMCKTLKSMGNFKKQKKKWLSFGTFCRPKFQIWYLSEFLVVLWPKYVILKKTTPRIHKKRPNKIFCKNLHWIVCTYLINLQKNDEQTVFEVYLTLTMPLNRVFRFLLEYGGWYLNCTYNYVCSPTEYENI